MDVVGSTAPTTARRARGVEELLRATAPQVLGILVRRYGQFDACEDAVQEALLAAAVQWPEQGVPANPRGWLVTIADRRLIDGFRSERARRDREVTLARLAGAAGEPSSEAGTDDSLRLLFLCCHPTLTAPSQIALTLRAVGGLTTAQIAQAFLVPETTMAQRISRAKQRIKAAGARFAMPPPDERAERLQAVLHVLYLIFNEGYTASSGPDLHRGDLTREAIRLARGLRSALPVDGEVTGLLALMLLTDAHRPARTGPGGTLIPLSEQDRTRWDRPAIDEGVALVTDALGRSAPGPYQLQAAIAAVHAEARTAAETDWKQIVALYRVLVHLTPNPMITLNQAAAVAMVEGPTAGLDLLASLDQDERIAGHHRLAAVRAHLLDMAGDHRAARDSFREAARRTTSLPERRYLESQAARLGLHEHEHEQLAGQHPPQGASIMSTATTPTTAALEVPGATLHYEIRGTGPVLLMICGGIYDAALLADLAGRLADDHTVITYDRRGNSRSPLTEQPGPQCVPVHADDAHRLLLAVAPGQAAAVFGNSSGAQIGLELAARHPEQVRTLVAHEPPVWDVLPDGAQWRALTTEAAAIYRASGVGPAMARFGAAMGMAGDHQDGGNNTNDNADGNVQGASGDGETADTAGPPEVLEMMSRMAANTEFFLEYEVESFGEHPTDVSALSAAGTRILLAAGEESAGQPPHRAALALADRLGSTPVIVPGGHGGFASHAEGFAVALDTVLSRN